MSYIRIYPEKNNTIFTYSLDSESEKKNSGANPVMELMDGKGYSKLLFKFLIPERIKNSLSQYSFKAKLKLFDSGTLFLPAIKLKDIKLSSFEQDFTEGDGYSFLTSEATESYSNWKNAKEGVLWSSIVFNMIDIQSLNAVNEDLEFDVSSSINETKDFICYSLEILNRELDTQVYRKFIHSRHTKTVFLPFLEIQIDDEIIDNSQCAYSNKQNKFYLVNKNKVDFAGVVSCKIDEQDITVEKERDGVYFVNFEKDASTNKNDVVLVEWFVNDVNIQSFFTTIRNINLDNTQFSLENLSFYIVPISTSDVVTKGDILPFKVVSTVRGLGDIIDSNYEYCIYTTDGFEMVPWTKTNVYRDTISFKVDTSYFFPENYYEIFLRRNDGETKITSKGSYVFRLKDEGPSHLRNLSTSPYYNRENMFKR